MELHTQVARPFFLFPWECIFPSLSISQAPKYRGRRFMHRWNTFFIMQLTSHDDHDDDSGVRVGAVFPRSLTSKGMLCNSGQPLLCASLTVFCTAKMDLCSGSELWLANDLLTITPPQKMPYFATIISLIIIPRPIHLSTHLLRNPWGCVWSFCFSPSERVGYPKSFGGRLFSEKSRRKG